MDRRCFLLTSLAGALGGPLVAGAQRAEAVWRIGWLGNGTRVSREGNTLVPLREGLAERGYAEGKNIVFEARWSEGDADRLARDAVELVRLKMDVIVTHGSVAGMAAKRATATIPIVIATAADLVGQGLVASLAQPGGNVTGISDQAGEVINKNLDIAAEIIRKLQRVAVLWHPANPSAIQAAAELQMIARRRGLRVTPLAAAEPADIPRSVDGALREQVQGLIVVQDSWALDNRARIINLALQKRLPVFGGARLYAESGALASYGADLRAVYKHAAVFIDRILKGVKPADIPVEQPTKFELVINLKTAKALGLTIPPSLLARADQLIG